MSTTIGSLWQSWSPELYAFLEQSKALAVGLFTVSGEIVYTNAGMRDLLPYRNDAASPLDYFVVPTFAMLCAAPASDTIVYQGWLTFGGPGLLHCSVRGEVRRVGEQFLVVAEYDVAELTRINREITGLNGEITNLQREVTIKKAGLERTLTELRETQALLIHSEKMNALGQLTAGVAHEINNPIAFIISNMHSLRQSIRDLLAAYTQLDQLVEKQGTVDQQQAAQSIRAAADIDFLQDDLDDLLSASTDGLVRVKRIVDDLRTFSRLDEAAFKQADLLANIQSTLAIARPELRHRVAVIIDADGLPPIRCYPAELNQVFLNLIVNAAQAIADQGTLTIRGRDTGAAIELIFQDTGAGMSQDVLTRCFDPFFTTKPVGSGTGLGLSMAYTIITHRHKGSIRVESEIGVGTIFTIMLPKEIQL